MMRRGHCRDRVEVQPARRRQRGERRGATAVEFAIVAPVFFLLLFASFEFARLNVIRHTADNAAYEAARVAMVPGGNAGEAVRAANDILGVLGARGARVAVNPSRLTPDTQEITVTVDVPVNANAWILPRFSNGMVMRSRSTLRTERIED